MPVVAVINRKGGSGKSTLATHLAAFCASNGIPVMLGDVDRQQSSQTWLRLRREQCVAEKSPIVGWAVDPKNVLRPPGGVRHVVLDTPGGLRDFDLARVVGYADAILMPVCNSVFDRESAADCYAELMKLPRVASGTCRVAAVGMRVEPGNKDTATLKQWAERQGLSYVGSLRTSELYARCAERGMTLFDMKPGQAQADRVQWQPILKWLEPTLMRADEGVWVATTRPGNLTPTTRPTYPVNSRPRPAASPVPDVDESARASIAALARNAAYTEPEGLGARVGRFFSELTQSRSAVRGR